MNTVIPNTYEPRP